MTDGDTRPEVVRELQVDPAMASLNRSLTYYYGDARRAAVIDAMYRRFVRPGDLVFDIGSHVGDRIASFRRLGARVVAVEPQPLCMRALRAIYAGDEQVALVEAACGQGGVAIAQIGVEDPAEQQREQANDDVTDRRREVRP